MENNRKEIWSVITYIENHLLEEKLYLDTIAKEAGYSKNHLHRMFTEVVGFPPYRYIQRRRLTEAARMLVETEKPIIEIALCAGYETQRSFSIAFRSMYHDSPKLFRKHKKFFPLQLKYHVNHYEKLCEDMILNIQTVEIPEILLIGYNASTK